MGKNPALSRRALLPLFSTDGVTGEESFCAFANLMILPAFISPTEDGASVKILDFFFFFLQIAHFGKRCLQAYSLLRGVHEHNIIHFCVSARLDKSRWQSMVNSVRPFVLLLLWIEIQWKQSGIYNRPAALLWQRGPVLQCLSPCLPLDSQSRRWQCKSCESSLAK